jgi:hypothetical protein
MVADHCHLRDHFSDCSGQEQYSTLCRVDTNHWLMCAKNIQTNVSFSYWSTHTHTIYIYTYNIVCALYIYIYTYSQISLVLLIHTAKSPFCCGKVVPKPIVHVSVGVLKKYHQHNSCFAIIFPLIARPIFFPVILAITWRHIPCPPRLPCLGRIADLRPQGLSHLFG